MGSKERGNFFGLLKARKKNSHKSPISQSDEPKDKTEADSMNPEPEKEEVIQNDPSQELAHLWTEYSDPLYEPVRIQELYWDQCKFADEMEKQRLEADRIYTESIMKASNSAMKRSAEEEAQEQTEGDSEEQKDAPEEEFKPEPQDGVARARVSRDGLLAWVYAMPPRNGGRELEDRDLLAVLLQAGIKEGIDKEAMLKVVDEKVYYRPVVIAKGRPAKNGVDGTVKDRYKRVITAQFLEDEMGRVDYKEQNWLQLAEVGDVIAEVQPAVPCEDGISVKGNIINAKIRGKDPDIPQGNNTVLSEDGTQLLAEMAGHVTCVNGKFQIAEILQVNSDVSNSTGNLRFNGDIAVEGDVRNGFLLEALGSILVKGSVEGAVLKAGGNIVIGLGVVGGNQAKLTADGDISCKYMESTEATAKGGIYAESMLWSKACGEKEVNVTKGRGVIIGGTIVSCGQIEAKIIGSQSRRMTELNLREVETISAEEERACEKELAQLRRNLSDLNKNIQFLKNQENNAKQDLLERMIIARDTLAPRESRLLELLKDARTNHGGLSQCRIFCSELYPIVKIQMGEAVLLVNEEHKSCNIFYNSEGEITIGIK